MKTKAIHKVNVILWMLLILGFAACTEETDTPRSAAGKGHLSFSQIEIDVNILNTPITKGATSSYNAPAPDALTYTITPAGSSTGEVYSYSELLASPVLTEGSYTLTATYGDNQMGTTPYLYYTTTFTIQALQTTTLPSISIPLACAIIRPSVDELLPHFQNDVQLTLSDETGNSLNVTNLTDYYVPTGKSYTLRLSGTNQLGEAKTIQGSITEAASRTRYILNCTADLPVFTLPEQPDYNAWSYHIDFIPLTESNISYTGGMEHSKILNNLTYEYTTDGGATWHAFNGTKLTGLTPSTTYTFRARLGAVQSSNQVSLTTEGAEPVPNGDFEDLVQTISVTEMHQGGKYKVWSVSYQNTCNFTIYEPIGWASINKKTCNLNATTQMSWFTVPSSYSTNLSWKSYADYGRKKNLKADIYSNLSPQNGSYGMILRSVKWDDNGTSPSTSTNSMLGPSYCKNAPSNIANSSAGVLFLGTYEYSGTESYNEGVSFTSRPIELKGWYKYQDYQNNECPTVTISLLNGSSILYSNTIELSQNASDYTQFIIPISYNDKLKSSILKIKFCSSNISSPPTAEYISETESVYRGAQLTIDNLTFTYD